MSARTSAPPSIPARRRFLRLFARLVRQHEGELSALAATEIGKPPFETLTADVLPLLASLDWHRRHLARLIGPRRIGGRAWWQLGQSHRVVRAPLGRVAIIATWNYPLQLLGVQLAQAIAAGNQVCVKPSERCPRTQSLLLDLAARALAASGFPAETLDVRDAGREEGARLLRDERFDHVIFTGSTSVGRAIAEITARTLTPTTLELSGHDSAFVLGDADVALAARTIWNGMTMNAGQTCMAPRRALVDRSIYCAFLAALAPLAAAGRPLRLVDTAAVARCMALVEDAAMRGARSLAGTIETADGDMMRPCVMVDCPTDALLVEGDHFGPALAVVPVDGLDEALRIHRAVGQCLATSVFTRDVRAVRERAADFGSSLVTINDCLLPTAHPAAALSGSGASGWGASRGVSGLLALTREICVSTTGRIRLPVGEPDPRVLNWLRRIVGIPVRAMSGMSGKSLDRGGSTAAKNAISSNAIARETHSEVSRDARPRREPTRGKPT